MGSVTALFTRSRLPIGQLICWGLSEPVSHCGFRLSFGDGCAVVVHSAFHGLEIVPDTEFLSTRELVYEVTTDLTTQEILADVRREYAAPYDYGAFAYWVIRTTMTKLFGAPKLKRNLWGSSHAFLCSEYLASRLISDGEPVLYSPYDVLCLLTQAGQTVLQGPGQIDSIPGAES